MKYIIYNKLINRFCLLKYKIILGIPLNDLDKKLIEILDEYNFLIDYIDDEQKQRSEEND